MKVIRSLRPMIVMCMYIPYNEIMYPGTEHQPLAKDTVSYGSTEKEGEVGTEASHLPQEQKVPVEVHTVTAATDQQAEEGAGRERTSSVEIEEKTFASHPFDSSGDVLTEALGIPPTEEEDEEVKDFERELEERAMEYSKLPKRFAVAVYYAFLSHSEYLPYFLVILNVILNGSVISLVYPVLMFLWGLLSIPWPSRAFWLVMVFYTMLVILIKYSFQFYEIDYWEEEYSPDEGLYPPHVLGIEYHDNILSNLVWDILLLIALVFHRELLKVGMVVSKHAVPTRASWPE